MPKSDEWYLDRTNQLVRQYQPSISKMRTADEMYHGQWCASWPAGAQAPDWWRDYPVAKPRTDLDSGVNMFATFAPKVKIVPVSDDENVREKTNEIEKALQWQYWLANNRMGANSVTKSIVYNVLTYGRSCAQVHYIPWMKKIAGNNRYKYVAGDFLIDIHHPSTCYPVFSSLGMESQVVVKEMDLSDVMATWGDAAKKLESWMDEAGKNQRVLYMDWTDYDTRFVSVFKVGGSTNTNAQNATEKAGLLPVGGDSVVIYREKNDIPFLNWVDFSTGSQSHDRPEDRARGLLDTIIAFNQWNNANIWHSYQRSYTFRSLARPEVLMETASGEPPRETTVGAVNVLVGGPGDRFQPMPQAQLDSRVASLFSEDLQEMGTSTIPELISNPSAPAGIAYASINEAYNLAESKIDPFINTAQDQIAAVDILMLRWYMHTNKNITGYEMKGPPGKESATGSRLSLDPAIAFESGNELDGIASGEIIYLTCELTAKTPSDEVQKLNGAMIYKNLGYADELIYEKLNEEDPEGIVKRRRMQMMTEAAFTNHLKLLSSEADIEIQKRMMEMQAQAQQGAQAGPPPQGPPPDSLPPDAAGGTGEAQVVPDQLTPGQQTQQAMARAGAGGDQLLPELASMMQAQGAGVDTGSGGMSAEPMSPGMSAGRRTERGKGNSRKSNR